MRHRLEKSAILGLAALAACAPHPQTAPGPQPAPITVIPIPASLATRGGTPFAVTPATIVVADTTTSLDVRRAASALVAILRPSTGYSLPIVATPDSILAAVRAPTDTSRRTIIRFRLATDAGQGAEGYPLAADRDSVVIVAAPGAGLFHGAQTLRQLFPYGVESHQSEIRMGPWLIPAMQITDSPRYGWRGAMLDVARHFFTPDEVKQYIDILALYKFNILHLHLADDQGWRIEIKSHPELTAKGSVTEVAGGPGGVASCLELDHRSTREKLPEDFVGAPTVPFLHRKSEAFPAGSRQRCTKPSPPQ